MYKAALLSLTRLRYPSGYLLYLILIGILGSLLTLWGLWRVQLGGQWLDFLLLLALALMTTFTTSTVRVAGSSITYAVDPIISFAALPTLGTGPAIVIKVLVTASTWLIKSRDAAVWKKSLPQLIFNIGMHALATFAAAIVLTTVNRWLGATSLVGQMISWLSAAIVYDQVNLWLLIGILMLQEGAAIRPLDVWREEWWATQLFVATYAIGGGILAFAIQHYSRLGIVIFFLPILLSAYAFRLYVQQMQTHLNNLEEIVKARTTELLQANRQKDTFLAVLSHDMMTPLASIRYGAGLIQSDMTIGSENRRLAELILRSQGTLFQMMRNILDIEKVIAGIPFAVNKQPCDLVELLLDITEVLQLQALETGITLHTEIENDLPYCVVDPQQIERIVNNLLSNALKYTEAEGTVWLRARQVADQIVITIEDTGYGIAPEELLTIFEYFKRAPQHRDKAIGSGLGLAITKALVEEHHGTISVKSEVGKGSTFTVQLPLNPRLDP